MNNPSNTVSLDDERLIRDGEEAVTGYRKAEARARDCILPMARGLLAARRKYRADIPFGEWLAGSPYRDICKSDRADLIKIGKHEDVIAKFIYSTTLLSPQTIWAEYGDTCEQLVAVSYDRKPDVVPPLNSNPPAIAAVKPENVETNSSEPENKAASYDVPKKSSLRDKIGPAADVLHRRFKHSRMFNSFLGEGKQNTVCAILRHLAKRCVEPDYPEELLVAQKWSLKLLYPYLPETMLMRFPQKIGSLNKNHASLVETEKRFKLTPECGVTDPPMVATNKANSIYTSVSHARQGGTVDPSVYHKPVYGDDEGKPPVIIRGRQLWPAEEGSGYRYDDLRCACGFAGDVVSTFDDTRGAPMTTRSLKLRHLMSWFPGGYNSPGAELNGYLRALKAVVQAYSSDESEEMRNPTLSLAKLD